jgi:hypothetical protein
VRAGRHVAGVDPLHAASLQRLELLEAVDGVRHGLAVDLNADRVETQRVALGEFDEHREMRVGGIQQPLFQALQLGRDAEDVRLDLLHLLVEPFHLLAVAVIGADNDVAQRAQHGEYRDPNLPHHRQAPHPAQRHDRIVEARACELGTRMDCMRTDRSRRAAPERFVEEEEA